jgi:PAS domain S-box-containing protein
MEDKLRHSGIDVIGSVPWGTHFCQFYQTKQDLIDILVPYFKAGLENNEFCMWITSEPLMVPEAQDAIRGVVEDFDEYLRRGQIEVIPYDKWYLLGGTFNDDRVLDGWVSKLKQALARGYSGLRLTGNTFWLERNHWHAFTEYEAKVNNVIGRYRMMALCTYNIEKCDGAAVIDVVRNHQFALIKQEGRWDIIESAIYKHAKEALLESEQDLNRAQAVAHTGSWRLDVGRNQLLWSDETHRVFGIPKGTPMTYETFLASVHPEDREYVDRKWTAALRGEYYDIEHRIIVGNEVRWVRERAELEFDLQGLLKGGFGTAQDITEFKQAEEALRQSEAKYRVLVESAPDGVASLDAEGRIASCNEALCSLLGCTIEEVRGRHISELATNPTQAKAESYHSQLAERGQVEAEFEAKSHHGQAVPLWIKAVTLPDWEGKPTQTIVYARDITERKRLEELKDEFIGLVSHELRSPLTVIIGAINTILSEGARLSTDEIRQLLEDATWEADSLSHLVENLLELSRAQANRLSLFAEPINIVDVVSSTIHEIRRRYQPQELIIEFPKELPPVSADSLRVQRVLYNLIENAIKYSPQGGQIRVFGKSEGDCLTIGVSDQGVGISVEDHGRLFQPFQRLEESIVLGVTGAGLGLLTCRRLVEAHGGRIWVESQPDRGSTFFFTLPLGQTGS